MAQGKVGMAADVSVLAMTADLGAEIRGVDLSSPLSDACFRRIGEVYRRYCMVFLRNQRLDPRLLLRFAAHFGEPEALCIAQPEIPGLPQIEVISDLHREARANGLTRYGLHWQTDGSYRAQPAAASLLYVVECPPQGAGLEFANQYAAFNALSRERQLFLEKLRVVHDRTFRFAELHPGLEATPADPGSSRAGAEHPVVRVHPETGRKALFVGKDIASHVLGLSAIESRRLLDELETFATQPRFVYAHQLRQGDLLLWDNRCTLHRLTACERKQDRVMYRLQVRGETPLVA